jgi:hypothetical protein
MNTVGREPVSTCPLLYYSFINNTKSIISQFFLEPICIFYKLFASKTTQIHVHSTALRENLLKFLPVNEEKANTNPTN